MTIKGMKNWTLNTVAWIFICCAASFACFILGAGVVAAFSARQQGPQIPSIDSFDAKTVEIGEDSDFRIAQQRYVSLPSLRNRARLVKDIAYSASGSIEQQTIDVAKQFEMKKNMNKVAWATAIEWCGSGTPACSKFVRCNLTGAVYQVAGLRTESDCAVTIVFLTNEQWGEAK